MANYKWLILLAVFNSFCFITHAQNKANAIKGKWINEDGTARFEMFEQSLKYFARIIWISQPLNEKNELKKDIHNPDKTLRNRPILNLIILKDFIYDSKQQYCSGGTIYAPEKGVEANCILRLNTKNELIITAFKGIFKITKKWKRYE